MTTDAPQRGRAATARGARSARRGTASALVLLALSVGALAACGSSSSPAPSGTYTTTISHPTTGVANVKGVWKITFGTKGTYTVSAGKALGLALGPGSVVHGNILTINPLDPEACGVKPSTGTYKMKLTGNKLTLTRIKDPCVIRSVILSNTFTKVG